MRLIVAKFILGNLEAARAISRRGIILLGSLTLVHDSSALLHRSIERKSWSLDFGAYWIEHIESPAVKLSFAILKLRISNLISLRLRWISLQRIESIRGNSILDYVNGAAKTPSKISEHSLAPNLNFWSFLYKETSAVWSVIEISNCRSIFSVAVKIAPTYRKTVTTRVHRIVEGPKFGVFKGKVLVDKSRVDILSVAPVYQIRTELAIFYLQKVDSAGVDCTSRHRSTFQKRGVFYFGRRIANHEYTASIIGSPSSKRSPLNG